MENAEEGTQVKKGSSRTILIIVGVVVILVIAVLGFMIVSQKSSNSKAQEATSENQQNSTSGNVISSIKDALASSQSLQCEYTDEFGRKMTTYMKNGAIRSDIAGKTDEETGSMIMKDKKFYYWSGKQGTMMEFDLSEISQKITPAMEDNANQQSPEEVVSALEKYKQYCKPGTVADSLFTPPAEVKFTDLSEMMKAAQKSPSGAGEVMTEEQIKQLQEKYQANP